MAKRGDNETTEEYVTYYPVHHELHSAYMRVAAPVQVSAAVVIACFYSGVF